MKKKLGILCTHPIQYYSPLFRHLTNIKSLDLTVYYCFKPTGKEQGRGFGVEFQWDKDLLEGYKYVWLKNIAKSQNSSSFNGCDTPEIANIISREKFDAFLVHGWMNKSMWQAMGACWKTKTMLLVKGDSHLHVHVPWLKRKIKNLIYPLFVKRFDTCLAMGRWSEEYFMHYGAKRVIKTPHSIDNKWFRQEAEKYKSRKKNIRKTWGMPEESIVYLFAGKMEEKKRPLDGLKALKKLIEDHGKEIKAHMLMVGDGILRQQCEAFVKKCDLPVTLIGFLNQSEMPKAYAASDILILPSDGRETWGLVVNEAMACGLPAIVSDQVGCGPDLIMQGKTGFVFPIGDISNLSETMYDAVTRYACVELGRASQEQISNYSIEKTAHAILEAVGAKLGK